MTAKNDNLVHTVAAALEEKIILQEYSAGSRLPENILTTTFNVGRSTIREALLLLEQRFMLSIKANKGARVSAITHTSTNALGDISKSILCCVIESTLKNPWTQQEKTILESCLINARNAYEEQNLLAFYLAVFDYLFASVDFPEIKENVFLESSLRNLTPSMKRYFFYGITLNPQQNIKPLLDDMEKLYTYGLVEDIENSCIHVRQAIDYVIQLICDKLPITTEQ